MYVAFLSDISSLLRITFEFLPVVFRNPSDPYDKSYDLSEFPTVEVEYPNTGAKET